MRSHAVAEAAGFASRCTGRFRRSPERERLHAVQGRLVAGPAPGSGKHRAQGHARTSQHIIKTAYFAARAPAAHQIRSAAGKHHRGSLCALPWRERRFELRAPAPSTGGALGPARLHVSRA